MTGQADIEDCIAQASIIPLDPKAEWVDIDLTTHTLLGWPRRVGDYHLLWAMYDKATYERATDHRMFVIRRNG